MPWEWSNTASFPPPLRRGGSFNRLDATGVPAPSKHLAEHILDILDPEVSKSLDGVLTSTSQNAVVLLSELHNRFG